MMISNAKVLTGRVVPEHPNTIPEHQNHCKHIENATGAIGEIMKTCTQHWRNYENVHATLCHFVKTLTVAVAQI